jgi:hypothetical protein
MRHWIGSHVTFANVVSLIALFVALGGTTYAATGGNFILGKPNTASSQTSLTASPSFAGKALQLTNTNTGAGATALGLNVASGHAPFTVNSGTKVDKLNADKLDGIDSSGFLGVNAKAADADQLDGIDSTGFLGVNAKAADAELLDGKNSTDFLSHDVVLNTADVTVNPGFGSTGSVGCPGSTVALGGGVGFIGGGGGPLIQPGSPMIISRPNDPLNGWIGGMTNNFSAPLTMRVYVICTS